MQVDHCTSPKQLSVTLHSCATQLQSTHVLCDMIPVIPNKSIYSLMNHAAQSQVDMLYCLAGIPPSSTSYEMAAKKKKKLVYLYKSLPLRYQPSCCRCKPRSLLHPTQHKMSHYTRVNQSGNMARKMYISEIGTYQGKNFSWDTMRSGTDGDL